MSATPAADAARPSLLDRFLKLFTDVKSGEGFTAILLTLNVFLLLSTYYIIKPVREALILASEGAEVKSYASAGQALLLLLVVPAYAKLSSHFNRRGLINVVTLIFAGCLVAFYAWSIRPDVALPLGFMNLTPGVAFFLWVGIFNVMIVAQFWSFANDIYTPEEGKRLFAIVAFGASAGAVLGSVIAEKLIEPIGVEQMLLVAAAILVSTLAITNWIDSREKRRLASDAGAKKEEESPEGKVGKGRAFRLVWSKRYLLLIAFLILLLNWVNTTGEYILGRVVSADAEAKVAAGAAEGLSEKDLVGKFYASFFKVVNIVGLAVQLFLVSRIIKWFGIRFAILALPIVALGGYAFIAFAPVLGIIRWVKTAENSIDYSLNNTVRHALFLPLSREEKYKREASNRYVLLARGGFAFGRSGVLGHANAGLQHAALRHGEHGARRVVAHDCVLDRPRERQDDGRGEGDEATRRQGATSFTRGELARHLDAPDVDPARVRIRVVFIERDPVFLARKARIDSLGHILERHDPLPANIRNEDFRSEEGMPIFDSASSSEQRPVCGNRYRIEAGTKAPRLAISLHQSDGLFVEFGE